MTWRCAAAVLVLAAAPGSAHRLDEYLQATILSVEKNQLHVEMTLTPGVAVLPILVSYIDTDGDGAMSAAEQHAYARRVLGDLSVTIDGRPLTPQLLSLAFPAMDQMKEGLGEIRLDFEAALPSGDGTRRIILENHHQAPISAYQVNCLVPRDPEISIASQNRNYSQSVYQLEYVQARGASSLLSFAWWSGGRGWVGVMALVLLMRLVVLWCPRLRPVKF